MDSDGIAKTILRDREKGASQLEATYREPLYSVAFSLCHDPTEAEDLVLRTIEQVIAKIDTYEEQDSFYNWMCVILKNLYIDSRRRKTLKGTISVGGPKEMEAFVQPVDADAIVENVDAEIVRRAIEKLPPKMREVLILHYFMDMPVKQIARTLRLAHGTVLSRLHHARRVLARRLGETAKKPAAVLALTGLVALGAMAIAVIGGGLFGDRSGSKSVIAKETHAPREVAFKWPDVKWPAAETTTRLEETPIIEEAPIIASAQAEPPLANTAEDSDTSDMDKISLSEVSFSPNQQYGEAEVSLLAKNQNGASDISFSANQQDGEATMNMQTIKTTARQAVLAAAVATTATLAANAAGQWTGNGGNTLWSNAANWDAAPGSSNALVFRNSNQNNTVTIDTAFSTSGNIHVSDGCTADNPYIFEATDPSNGLEIKDDIWLGYFADSWLWIKSGTYIFNGTSNRNTNLGQKKSGTSNFRLRLGDGSSNLNLTVKGNTYIRGGSSITVDSGTVNMEKDIQMGSSGAATLTINGGTLTVGSWTRFENSNTAKTINLNGGTMKTFLIRNAGGSGSMTVNFNGGTLFATGAHGTFGLIDSGITVNIKEGGGTIDNGGKNVSIPADLTPGSNPGTLTFKGSGTTTLAGDTLQGLYTVLEDGYMIVTNGDTKINKSLTINGGTFESAVNTWTRLEGGTLNLNGGTLKARHLHYSSGSPVINFNGGTLMVTQSYNANGGLIQSGITVNVNASGGIIDSGNCATYIESALGGTGGMTFTGGNTITLNGSVNYSGATAVTPGTALALGNSDAKTNILKNGLVLAGLPVADQTVVTSTSAFEDADLAKVSCLFAPTTTFKFTDETKTAIAVDTPGATINYWTGAADNDLSNDANWSSGTKPTGEAYIICATPETLTKGASFVATAFTFLRGSEAVTIAGDFSDITQIANNSSSMVEFTGAVAFAGNVDVVQNTGAVKFTGGVTGTQLARATDIHGTYTFTKTGDHTEFAGTVVKSDGVYNLPNGCFYNNAGGFSVEEGGMAVVKSTKENGDADNSYVYLAQSIAGTFIATDEIFSGKKPQNSNLLGGTGGADLEHGNNGGVFFANKVRVANGGLLIAPQKIAIGSGGILRGSGIVRVANNGSHYFGSLADWSMYKSGEADSADPILIKYNSTSSSCVLTFDTRNYTNDAAQVITCKAPICAVNADTASTLSAIVKGNGTFSFECSYNDTGTPKWFSGGLTVQDSATVEVKPNAKPGKGAITLGAGTTLALTSNSDTYTLANTLNLPTTGIATLRIDGKRLRSGEGLEIATIGNAASVTKDNVKIEGDAIGGRKTTLRIEDGKLLLNIQPEGLMVIFR